MKKRRPKHKGNFACRLIGWHDRIFRVVALSSDGMATSSFIEGRKSLFVSEASMAVEKAQSKIIAARSKGDEIIAQFIEDDIRLIGQGSSNVYEERRRKKVFRLFEELVVIRNEIKSVHVTLHSELDESQSEVKRELTAYLLAAFSRKKSVDIVKNASVDYKDMITYQTYTSTYRYADKAINEAVDRMIRAESLLDDFGKEAS